MDRDKYCTGRRQFVVGVTGGLVASLAGDRLAGQESPASSREIRAFRELRAMSTSAAHQAVCGSRQSCFAIANREIRKYHFPSHQQLAQWKADTESPVRHLNSGMILDQKLYAAHSNWPAQPLENTIEVWDAESLQHERSIKLHDLAGAATWVDRHQGQWWIGEAFYGTAASVARTRVHRCDDDFQRRQSYRLPDSVVQRLVPYSNSGASWGPDGLLYLTGHDRSEVYMMQLPSGISAKKRTDELVHVRTVAAPIEGQGIAWDRDTGRLWGIRRSSHEVVLMEPRDSSEPERTMP